MGRKRMGTLPHGASSEDRTGTVCYYIAGNPQKPIGKDYLTSLDYMLTPDEIEAAGMNTPVTTKWIDVFVQPHQSQLKQEMKELLSLEPEAVMEKGLLHKRDKDKRDRSDPQTNEPAAKKKKKKQGAVGLGPSSTSPPTTFC